MAWTTPKTWTSEVLTSNDMNTYLSDNTQYLYDEITATLDKDIYRRLGGSYSTTSTSYVQIDAANLTSTITTTGGDVLISLTAAAAAIGGTLLAQFEIDNSGTTRDVLRQTISTSETQNVSFTYTEFSLAPGTYTFTIRWKTSANTLQMPGFVLWSVRELPK